MRGNRCHICERIIEDTKVPIVTYVVTGPVVSNMTPDEALDLYGDQLSDFQRVNLEKNIARTVWCGSCAAGILKHVPSQETERIKNHVLLEREKKEK